MNIEAGKWIAVPIASGLYWHLVCRVSGVNEPWDASGYWNIWYPASLALSAVAAAFVMQRAWLTGALVTFSQLPIMRIDIGEGSMWIAGLAITAMLAVPAIAVSALAGGYAARIRSR